MSVSVLAKELWHGICLFYFIKLHSISEYRVSNSPPTHARQGVEAGHLRMREWRLVAIN